MRKHCSNVSKLCPCLDKELKNSARIRTIMTTALQRQYSQTELIFWITLVFYPIPGLFLFAKYNICWLGQIFSLKLFFQIPLVC